MHRDRAKDDCVGQGGALTAGRFPGASGRAIRRDLASVMDPHLADAALDDRLHARASNA